MMLGNLVPRHLNKPRPIITGIDRTPSGNVVIHTGIETTYGANAFYEAEKFVLAPEEAAQLIVTVTEALEGS